MKVAVVGAGSWGSTFASLLVERRHDVTLVCRDPDQADAIASTGRNLRYVETVDLSGVRTGTPETAVGALAAAELVCIAVPSRAFADVVRALPQSTAPVLSLVKGLDPTTGDRLSTLVEGRPVAVLAGPNHAEEIAEGLPAAAVVASADARLASRLQHAIISPRFRVYTNTDIVGVEVAAAAKNVIALAAGLSDGLRLGDNAKAALLTRGLAEMRRVGRAVRARSETFSGLAGMGDLVVTCWSHPSRNRLAGELIGRGAGPEDAIAEAGTVEGATTAPVLRRLGRSLGFELPLTEAVCEVLAGARPADVGPDLMSRTPTAE